MIRTSGDARRLGPPHVARSPWAASARAILVGLFAPAVIALIVFALAGLPSRGALAAPKGMKRATAALVKRANRHYKKGQFIECAALFHKAWDKQKLPVLLFNAARCEQRSFKFEAAERDYAAVLALEGLPAVMEQRARSHLAEVRDLRARFGGKEAGSDEAGGKEASGKDGPRSDGAQGGESAGGGTDGAAGGADPPAGAATDAAASGGASAGVSAAGKTSVTRIAAWSSLGLGAVVALAGGVLWGLAESDQADLNAQTDTHNVDGQIATMRYDDYTARQTEINDSRLRWQVVTFSGLAVAGTGAILIWLDRDGRQISMLPAVGPGTLGWTLSF